MSTETSKLPQTLRLLTVTDVADALKIHTGTVYRMVDRGDLPRPLKIGASNRWRVTDLETWIAERGAPKATA